MSPERSGPISSTTADALNGYRRDRRRAARAGRLARRVLRRRGQRRHARRRLARAESRRQPGPDHRARAIHFSGADHRSRRSTPGRGDLARVRAAAPHTRRLRRSAGDRRRGGARHGPPPCPRGGDLRRDLDRPERGRRAAARPGARARAVASRPWRSIPGSSTWPAICLPAKAEQPTGRRGPTHRRDSRTLLHRTISRTGSTRSGPSQRRLS